MGKRKQVAIPHQGVSIKTIIQELKVAKTNAKKEIIRTRMSETLKEVFISALSPLYNYQMKHAPTTLLENRPRRPLLHVLQDLEIVRDRTITGKACKEYVQELHDSLEEDDRFVFRCVIEKDLRCGVQATLVNSALGELLIPQFPKSLCSAYSEKALDKISIPAIAQEKLDGARGCFIIEEGTVSLRSRNGRLFHGLFHLEEAVLQLGLGLGLGDCMIDSELTVVQTNVTLDRKKGNGILNKSIRGTISKQEASLVRATVFDVVPLSDWKKGYSARGYNRRWLSLQSAVLSTTNSVLSLPDTTYVYSIEEARSLYANTLLSGKEGIILKDALGTWRPSRLSSMVKMKVQDEVELEIVGICEGTGKNIGLLGAFACSTKDKKLLVNVGSGYTDEERCSFFTKDMIGRIITVAANDYISREGNNVFSLYLPTYVELREDKDEADSFRKVKNGFDMIYGRSMLNMQCSDEG